MTIDQLVVWVVVGGLAGILADAFVSGIKVDLVGAIIIGVLGAFIGGWLFGVLSIHVGSGLVGQIIESLVGAVVLLLALRSLRRL